MKLTCFWLAAALTLLGSELASLQEVADAGARKHESAQEKSTPPATQDPEPPLTAPLHLEVPKRPWAFKAGSKWHLVYELYVTNIGSVDCSLTRIEILSAGGNLTPLAKLVSADIEKSIVQPFNNVSPATTIPPSGFAVVYMWVTVDRQEDVPAAIIHRVTMTLADYPKELHIRALPVAVKRDPVPVIGPPLRGGHWAAAHGPNNDNHHRRGLLTIEGHAYIGERFAIDWLRITPSGDIYTGDAAVNKNYPGYGAEVLAVADGTITEVLDGVQENIPGGATVSFTLKTICGNHVVLRLGEALFASYCHLQPGSIRVRPGAKVKRGQVLALVGNSGSSGAPHLHFHVCDANSVLTCEGVPYAFRSFVEESKNFDSADGTKRQPDVVHRMEIPTFETLVRFPD